MPHNKQKEVFADCEAQGEEEVRNQLAWGRWNEENAAHVRLWLSRKEESRSEASKAAQMKLTRSAKNAAWAAAIAAIVAAIAALLTLWLSSR